MNEYYYKNKQESSQLSQTSPSNRINNNYNNDNNLINENDVIEQSSQVSAEIEQNQNNNNNEIVEVEKEVEDDDKIKDEVENEDKDENEETHNILLNHIAKDTEITKQELSAAYLSAFYSGSITQESLTTFLQLHNIHSPIKIPTSFSNLTNVLSKNGNLFYNQNNSIIIFNISNFYLF